MLGGVPTKGGKAITWRGSRGGGGKAKKNEPQRAQSSQRKKAGIEGKCGLGLRAAVEFGLEVIAEGVGDDAGGAQIAEVVLVYVRKEGEDGGEGCAWGSNEGEADAVDAGPAAVVGDGVRNGERNFFAGECFEDLGFGEVGVIEDDRKNLWMAFGEESASDSGRAATGERDFLAERKLGEAR